MTLSAEDYRAALFDPRESVWERFPGCRSKGEIYTKIDEYYSTTVTKIPWFSEAGEAMICGHPLNIRNLVSAQRKYTKRVLDNSYDPQSRSLPMGIMAPDGKCLLFGGKQLSIAIYNAIAKYPEEPNVKKALADGYTVGIRPHDLPRDVIEFLVEYQNLNNRGIRDTVASHMSMVPRALLSFKQFLASKQRTLSSLPRKGDYSAHKLLAKHIKDHFGDTFKSHGQFASSKKLFDTLRNMPVSLAQLRTMKNSTNCENVTVNHSSSSTTEEDAEDEMDMIFETNHGSDGLVEAFVHFVQETGDAEAIESDMDRVLAVSARWAARCASFLHLFASTEHDLQMLRVLFFTGLEAIIPIDTESEAAKTLHGTPILPRLFDARSTFETVDSKFELLSIKVVGVPPSVVAPQKGCTPKRGRGNKSEEGDCDAFRKLVADSDVVLSNSVSTEWIDTVKSLINQPFNVLQKLTGGEAHDCKQTVMQTIIRRALWYAWTATAPPMDPAPKKWGILRRAGVNMILEHHPERFSRVALEQVTIQLEGSTTSERGDVDSFLKLFNETDAASSFLDDDVEAPDTASTASNADSGARDAPVVTINMAKRFRRLFKDEGMMMTLSAFAAECKLSHEWGYQLLPCTQDLLVKGSALPAIKDGVADETKHDAVEALCSLAWDILADATDNNWFDFAESAALIVYNAPGSDGAVPQNVLDTCSAMFGNSTGCVRFRDMRAKITAFAIDRLIGPVYELPIDDAFFKLVASNCTPAFETKTEWAGLWTRALKSKTLEELRHYFCGQTKSTPTKDAQEDSTNPAVVSVKVEPATMETNAEVAGVNWISDAMTGVVPGTQGSPSLFGALSSYIEFELRRQCSPGNGLCADYGWNLLYEKNGIISTSKVSRNMRLNYYGTVSTIASEGRLKIGQFLGADFYVSCTHKPCTPFFIPAYGAKPAKSAKKGSTESAEQPAASEPGTHSQGGQEASGVHAPQPKSRAAKKPPSDQVLPWMEVRVRQVQICFAQFKK